VPAEALCDAHAMCAMSIRQRTAWRGVLAAVAFAAHVQAAAAQSLLESMAAAVGPTAARHAVTGLATRADGTGPRGAFTTEIVSHGEVVRFVQVRGGNRTAILVTGNTSFVQEAAGNPMQASNGPEAAFVQGHDLHRLLLGLDSRLQAPVEDAGAGCVAGMTAAGRARLCRRAGDAVPSELTLTSPGSELPVVVEFSDWRPLLGVTLPFAIDYRRGGERHEHRFTAVLPFALAPGVALPTEPGAAFDRLGDLADLAALHRGAIDAHLTSDVTRLAAGEFERSTVARRGELVESTREALVARLGPYLRSLRFTRYEDVRVPVVAVANDGSLGWVACEIEAEGLEVSPSGQGARVAYAFSWIETAIRRDGRWLRNGNASSARP
jgi:hypothetical protein